MLIKDNKRLFNEQTTIIRAISSGSSLKDILELIVNSFEEGYPTINIYSSIMLYDPVQKTLGSAVSLSLPQAYLEMIKTIGVGPYEGSCGTAAYNKKPIIVSDINLSPHWEKHRKNADPFGFRACWSVPILSSEKELLGTFAMYYKEVQTPTEEMFTILAFYTDLAAIAIENNQAFKNNSERQIRNTFDIEKNLDAIKEQNKDMLFQLKNALEKEEFEIYYQPCFMLEKEYLGVEALIRWNHPSAGILPPADFLDVAEQTGFILELEKWVLNRSIQDIKTLNQRGFSNLQLSVNISAQQLENPVFPDLIEKLLQRNSFSPEKLTLEITERFLIKKETITILNSLKSTGVRVSIDDFGTAYSSLQYLKDLRVDELKIDRSFISNMEECFNNQKIVEMIIMLAHQLEMQVVAEGVETVSQLELLKNMKCDIVQGFLFSKPIPLAELEEKYRNEPWSVVEFGAEY